MSGTRDHRAGGSDARPAGAGWPLRAALAATILVTTACSGPPGPRETRIQRGLGDRVGVASTGVEGVAGAGITSAEIRGRTVEPRCAELGLVMTSLRIRRRDDGAQEFTARCGIPFGAAMTGDP